MKVSRVSSVLSAASAAHFKDDAASSIPRPRPLRLSSFRVSAVNDTPSGCFACARGKRILPLRSAPRKTRRPRTAQAVRSHSLPPRLRVSAVNSSSICNGHHSAHRGRRQTAPLDTSLGFRYNGKRMTEDYTPFLPLSPAALHILLSLAGEDRHGYGIMQEVARQSDGQYKTRPRHALRQPPEAHDTRAGGGIPAAARA